MAAWCPQDYSCTFTQIHPRVITVTHNIGPWWHTWMGFAVAATVVVAIAVVLIYVASLVAQRVKAKHDREEAKLQRQAKKDLEEQRTMQMDAAKGNPEMLKIVKGWDYNR